MSHKYDEFYRLLVDAHVTMARAVREAEKLGLGKTLAEVKDLYNGQVKVANNVMTKIESDHIAGLLDADKAPSLSSPVKDVPYKSARLTMAQSDTRIPMTPHFMYMHINEERNCHHVAPADTTPAAGEGLADPAPDPGCGPTD